MIGKTSIGSSFKGCVNYQFEGHKNSQDTKKAEVLEAVGVRADSAADMIADFNRGRKLNPALGKAVWHTSISFNPDDAPRLTSEKMLAVAQDYVKGMGLDQTQYAVIRHHDKDHPHFHIVANRVANDGKTISDSHNYKRSEQLLKQLVVKHQLTPVGEKRPQRMNPRQLVGADQVKHEIYQSLTQILKDCREGNALNQQLKQAGIAIQVHRNTAHEPTGVSFEKNGYRFKGSEIDRKLSLRHIASRMLTNAAAYQREQERLQASSRVQPTSSAANPVQGMQSPVKRPELSEVERKWQKEYLMYAEKINASNAHIRASNEQIHQVAAYLQQNPTLEAAQKLGSQVVSYPVQQLLREQVKNSEFHEWRTKWIQAQKSELTRQAGQWLGLSEGAREAKQKLAYLNDPKGSGLDYQMREKHYDFWLYAKDAQEPKPKIGFEAQHYQKEEKPILSLLEFAQRKETMEREQKVQEQERQQQRQYKGPRLGR